MEFEEQSQSTQLKGRLKVPKKNEDRVVDRMDERAPSPIPLSPPSSPMSERREARTTTSKESGRDEHKKKNETSPINIPISKAKTMITPGLEVSSLTSLSQIPTSKFIVGRSHYTSQPITIEYYVTERLADPDPPKGQGKDALPGPKVLKQTTTIRSIGDYQIIRTIGSGSTGKVKLGVNLRTQKKVAIKIISRKYIHDSGKKSKETPASRKRRILREAAILNLAHHPNIVRLYDLYITEEYYCMVFEYVDGAQMLDFIINQGKMKESQAQKFFSQLLSAVSYCHDNGIVHRDLKIENVLIDSEGNVKLVDFGLSNFFDPTDKLRTFCGSLYFAAPELLKGIYYTGPEIDIWSLGIVLYVLVCGKVPFDDKSLTALHDKIKLGKFELPEKLTSKCQNLLKSMIEVDPKRRARMDEIVGHSWTQANNHVVPSYFLGRDRLTSVNPDIERFLIREFPYQYEEEEIRRVLRSSLSNWEHFSNHPLVALYFLAAQKQERQQSDPFSSSPQIPAVQNIKTEISTSKSFDSSASPMRKRTESLPTPVKVMKSKRSSSIQGGPSDKTASGEEGNNLFAINEDHGDGGMKVRTVYLRGIFSVNTTSTRSPTEIRGIIIKCLTEKHQQSIIFLDRESYFICEYQSTSISGIIKENDDEEEAQSVDDIDISQIDLAESEETKEDSAKLIFGAAPLRSIRFEIHIVKVALLGMNGIQFKRISGDFGTYKNLCSQLITEFNL